MRVGIVGAGGMGNVHANQYAKMPDVELFVYDGQPERADALCARTGARCLSGLDALIEGVDVVDACVPTDLHRETAERAFAAGKPVFMEKPLARTLEDGEAIVAGAARTGVPLMIGQVVRYFPEFRRARELVLEGVVGTPAAARLRRGGKAPQGSRGWFMDHRRSGGVLLDLAIHDFDWLRWTFGEVTELTARSVGIARGEGPDYALTTLAFTSGVVAHVESTWMDPSGFRVTYEVAGSGGLLQFDSRECPTLQIHGAKVGGADHLRVAETPLAPTDDPYCLELRAFLDAVRDGTPVPVPGEEGLAALRIALAAVESARLGRTVRLQG